MEQDFILVELFELYKELLTDRQRELFGSHYLYDLSLSEIADPENLSRQSVYDAIKKVKLKLYEYEKVLGLREKFNNLKEVASKTKDEQTSRSILEIIGR